MGPLEPDQDLELEAQLLLVVAGLGQVAPPAAEGEVVGTALEQAGPEVPGQPVLERGQVFGQQLLLERVGVGGNDDALAAVHRPRQRRHKVSQALAGAGAGLDREHPAAPEDLRDRQQHLVLRLPKLVTGEAPEQLDQLSRIVGG